MTTDAAQTMTDLRALTDPQARELYAYMMESGQLPPPPELCSVPTAQLADNLRALTVTLTGQALAWGDMAPQGSPAMHFANGLLYALAFIGSAETLDSDPLNILSLFSTWAAGLAREVMTEAGLTEREIDKALETAPSSKLFDRLGEPMARGASGAALGCFYAGAMMVAGGEHGDLMPLFAALGHGAAGPDFMPSKGEGVRA